MNKPKEDILELWFDNTVGQPTLLILRRDGDKEKVINTVHGEEAEEIYNRLSASPMVRKVEELLKERGLNNG